VDLHHALLSRECIDSAMDIEEGIACHVGNLSEKMEAYR
jgi:hypothetical protein